MEVVEEFLKHRRAGNTEEAISLLHENASVTFPYGGTRTGKFVKQYLMDEPKFTRRGYLSSSIPITEIAEGTYQRRYKFNTGINAPGNHPFFFLYRLTSGYSLPVYRELYFVRNGKIAGVSLNTDPGHWGFNYLIEHLRRPVPYYLD